MVDESSHAPPKKIDGRANSISSFVVEGNGESTSAANDSNASSVAVNLQLSDIRCPFISRLYFYILSHFLKRVNTAPMIFGPMSGELYLWQITTLNAYNPRLPYLFLVQPITLAFREALSLSLSERLWQVWKRYVQPHT